MGKFEKKFESLLKTEDIDKILSAINNQLKKDKKIEEKSEAFDAINLFFKTCKEKSWVFPDNLLNVVIMELNHDNWIIRRNALNTLRDLANIFHEKLTTKEILTTLRQIYKEDDNWAVRNASIEALGKIGVKIPDRIVPFLIDQMKDPDADVRLSIIGSLKEIYLKNQEKLERILPIFVKAYKEDSDFRISVFAEEAIKEFAEKKKAQGTAYQKVDVDKITCPHCKESVPATKEVCSSCGKSLPVCQICNKGIISDTELVTCPHCHTNFHVEHFLEWYRENKNCPVCLGHFDFKG
ncbi:MAG: hypothetical protein EAX96_19765 [Candidatus Lokiarchaeota archaeon]|nr:hypothetical protein [Candidatus Lokiarchaeota archaeon]